MGLAEDVLAHHGVKGMKWGVRRDNLGARVSAGKAAVNKEISNRTGSEVVVKATPGQMVRTVGGNKRTAHPDAVSARTSQQVAKKSSLDALSNKDLQNLVTRMNLESQYRNLNEREDRRSRGEKFVNKVLEDKQGVAVNTLPLHPALSAKIVEQALKRTAGPPPQKNKN